jgi:hypothetical protein
MITPMAQTRTHCRYGHELTPENTYAPKNKPGARWCKTCKERCQSRFLSENPLRSIWGNMIRRCIDPSFCDWHLYGGRIGNPVKVCERWYSYQNFVQDMPPRPSLKHTIDRIDGSKGYEPGNVKWSTATEQARNTSRNIFFEYDGLRLTLGEWAERSGIKYMTLYFRIFESKMLFSEAISAPVGLPTAKKGYVNAHSRLLTLDGITLPMIQWAERMSLPYKTVKNRIRRGMDLRKALTEPVGISGDRKARPPAKHLLTFGGNSMSVRDWESHLNLPKGAIKARVDHGWDTERIFTQPFRQSRTTKAPS